MLTFGDTRRIFLARQATDRRKGCASLAAVVENALGHDPYVGDIFVFVGKHAIDRRLSCRQAEAVPILDRLEALIIGWEAD